MKGLALHRDYGQSGSSADLVSRLRNCLSALPRPPQIGLLGDGRRLHLHDGPIDLIIDADGRPNARLAAFEGAIRRFVGLLDELCRELGQLRAPAETSVRLLSGKVAQRMQAAVMPLASHDFITPMAAVAGAVADEILAAMRTTALPFGGLARAMVNNGGDIAIHLDPHEKYRIGLVDRPDRGRIFSKTEITASQAIGGIATSGFGGRSFTFGIADAVTVLARNAAAADAAATIIANAVDLPGHPSIRRVPARSLQSDTDLGDRLVTDHVGMLTESEIGAALAHGATRAGHLLEMGLIAGACLHLRGQSRTCGLPIDDLTRKEAEDA